MVFTFYPFDYGQHKPINSAKLIKGEKRGLRKVMQYLEINLLALLINKPTIQRTATGYVIGRPLDIIQMNDKHLHLIK